MKAGDIVFFQTKGIVSWLIRKVSNGFYNHVAIAISDKLVLESEWNSGTRIRNIEAYEREGANIRVLNSNATDGQIRALHGICNSYLSAKFYDWKQIIKLFLKYVFHITTRSKNNQDKVICSELVAIVMLELGMTDNLDALDFSPQELYDYLVGEGYGT